MKEIIIKKQVYTYNELNDEAKENAKREWLEIYHTSEGFYEIIKEFLKLNFPNSDLDTQFSLACCQGDGVNIYGALHLEDILNFKHDYYTLNNDYFKLVYKEFKTRKFMEYIKLPYNNNYTYCLSKYLELPDYLDDDKFNPFKNYVIDVFEDICKEFEDLGYSFFYEINDNDFIEICKENEIYFYDNGSIFYD